ncbi:hypothetical protein [Spiroplasma endosymbiont of Cantharis rufa]|uniref:hypothetical protein n=1 Tax=Spiroplasma endosymbiont of Cantharis rufa TaxID=3066279 RepID=UPI0030D13F11
MVYILTFAFNLDSVSKLYIIDNFKRVFYKKEIKNDSNIIKLLEELKLSINWADFSEFSSNNNLEIIEADQIALYEKEIKIKVPIFLVGDTITKENIPV